MGGAARRALPHQKLRDVRRQIRVKLERHLDASQWGGPAPGPGRVVGEEWALTAGPTPEWLAALGGKAPDLIQDLQSPRQLSRIDVPSSLNKIRFIAEKTLHRLSDEKGVAKVPAKASWSQPANVRYSGAS